MKVESYFLDLDVDYASESFRGDLTIRLASDAERVELDAVELEVHDTWVGGTLAAHGYDAAGGKLTIELPRAGDLDVRITYSGKVRKDVLNGFYVSASGEKPLFTTMMEPVGCRRLLPCLDAPNQKAVFRLRVTTDPSLMVLSNAAVESNELWEGRRRWTFAPTPRMSTYLLYLGIGPFETIETVDDGIRIIAAAGPAKAEQARKGLELAGPLLRAYGEFYGIRYPLPKLHLIAVPDLWAGGMENWGAIVFPELGLLWDDSTSPAVVRWAVETMAHEVAHQWFGNLVTMETFNDLWLNESFATFVAAKMEDRLHLRDDAWSEFRIRTAPGFFGDSLRSTHPVQLEIVDPAEISQSVDEITYFKGANIVRMIETFLGEEVFRRGVAAYLQRFQYGNARGEDLWEALEAAAGQPVRRVMRSWVERPGLPVISVEVSGETLQLRQRRFSFLGPESAEPPWPIPLVLRENGDSRPILFDQASVVVPLPSPGDLVVNPGRAAFVRIWYQTGLRERMISKIAVMDAVDRWAFLSDAAAFVLSGDYPLIDYLAAVREAHSVSDYPSVSEVAGSLQLLALGLGDRKDFQRAHLEFNRAQLDRIGMRSKAGESDTEPVLRERILENLTRVDDELARTLARGFGQIDSLDPALRDATALAFARQGSAGAMDTLFQRLTSTASEDAAEQAALALGGLPTSELLAEAMDRATAPGVRTQHLGYLVASAARNPLGRGVTWAWMQENLREFERRSEGSWMLAHLLQATIPSVGLDRTGEVIAYFARERFPEGRNGVQKGLELLEVLARLRQRYSTDI